MVNRILHAPVSELRTRGGSEEELKVEAVKKLFRLGAEAIDPRAKDPDD
jgi:hypothetical protein